MNAAARSQASVTLSPCANREASAALLYLAVEELLVEAHEEQETPLLGAMFFLGFLIIYILGEIAA